jgi:hypothetical protein
MRVVLMRAWRMGMGQVARKKWRQRLLYSMHTPEHVANSQTDALSYNAQREYNTFATSVHS